MIDIVIPYLHTEVVWDELRFTVRSIDKYFSDNYRLWLFGDKHPKLKINHIPIERIKNKPFAKALDSVVKMKAIVEHPEISENFIYWYDDILLLKKIDLSFFMQNYVIQNLSGVKRREKNNYLIVLWKTYDKLIKNNCSVYNYETHLPRLFNKTKMKTIISELQKNELILLNSYYFNKYQESKPIFLHKEDRVKAGFYGVDDFYSFENKNISEGLKNKTFLSYNNLGLSKVLKNRIVSEFKIKSKFE